MSDENKVLMRVSNLKQYFPIGKKKMGKPQSFVKANDGISLNIYEGETFGLDRKSTRLNSSHIEESRMPSSA